MKKTLLLILSYLLTWPVSLLAVQDDPDAYVFSAIDHRQGISNSAVICIFKDKSELMWFGTYDGVNCFDGKEMEIFRSDFSSTPTLDNNVIYGISQGDGNNLWISTLLGVNRFSRDDRRVVANYSVQPGAHLCSNVHGDTWLIASDSLSYYNTFYHRFVSIGRSGVTVTEPANRSFVANDGSLWIFPDSARTGTVYKFSIGSFDTDDLTGRAHISPTRFHHKPVESIFSQNNVSFCFIDSEQDLYMYDIVTQAKVRIRNMGSLIGRYGHITGLVPFYDDFIVAFRTNGLMRLKAAASHSEEIIDQNLRVFCLYKDPEQGILWIGADGRGAMMYTRRHTIATNLMTNTLSPNFTRQVRSIMTDNRGGLWFGSKGDGLVYITDYAGGISPDKATVFFPEKKQSARTYTRGETEFPVYMLSPSRFMDGFWIGSGPGGLYYHIYGEQGIHHLQSPSGIYLNEVHAVHEANDSTLYVATAHSGFSKLTLERQGARLVTKGQRRYRFFHEQQEISTFFSMHVEGDSILWLGSRERGLVRFNMDTDEYQVISLREKLGRAVDDVLSICRVGNGDMFVGTTAGLVRLRFDGKKIDARYTGREEGFLNDMIHGILEDANGFLWLSTNKGLLKYNPGNGSAHAYYYSGGVHIGEFSDDAYYKCPYTERLFFGGIDGLLYIDKSSSVGFEYYPEVLLRKLFFGRTQVNLGDYYDRDAKGLEFKYTDDSFKLSFAAPDFISGPDIEYSWMLEGYDTEWQPFGVISEASYERVPAGNYLFKVRYRKDIFDTEVKNFEIPVRIIPLWYQTAAASILFALLALGVTLYIIFISHRYIENRRITRRLLESEKKSMSGNSSTYLSHEFVDVLTSIYQACDYLRAEDTTHEERCEKIERIRENVMSLFLPTDIFHGAGAGKFFSLRFTTADRIPIKDISDEVLALLRNRKFNVDNIKAAIAGDFIFPVYRNAFRYFFYYVYLIASDLRRTDFSVYATQSDGMMMLTFKSAKGILKKLHASLTEEGYELPVPSRDPDAAFGMHLLHHFVRTMTEQLKPVISYTDNGAGPQLTLSFREAVSEDTGAEKKSLLLLEDNDEMCWLVSDILSAEYRVHQVRSIQQAFEFIKQSPPVVFLVDMMMYGDAEQTFMEFMNRNRSLLKTTAFIPMFTWKVSSAMRSELVLLADSDIALPNDIIFLKEIAHKAIYGRKKVSKQIHIEELGDFSDLITCTTEEQVGFIRRVITVIEENLDREDLGSSFIAEQMAMSTRQFYRRFKEISGLPPTELIKNYRMEKAAVLLLDQELSIQDVISDVGISSRSYFYKEFTRRFGMTPKIYREEHGGARNDSLVT